MAQLIADCPRCGVKNTAFDLYKDNRFKDSDGQYKFESYCVCRNCKRSTVFILSQTNRNANAPASIGAVNREYEIEGYISLKDLASVAPPEHITNITIKDIFSEGATCLAVECYNAACTMFRLCVDLATKEQLPKNDVNGLNNAIRRSLGLRLKWLFETNRLPADLEELSTSIKDDGNDGAHEGTLKKADAEDLLDFTYTLLERLYTEPVKLKLAKARRDERRNQTTEE